MGFKRRLRPNAEFSTSSIADIVFLLLIFFLLTSKFVNQSSVKVDLPQSQADKPSDGNVSVTISADGSYFFKGEELGAGESREEKENLLIAEIQDYLSDSTLENRTINLRGDTAISYGAAAVVISAVSEMGGAVAFQTKK